MQSEINWRRGWLRAWLAVTGIIALVASLEDFSVSLAVIVTSCVLLGLVHAMLLAVDQTPKQLTTGIDSWFTPIESSKRAALIIYRFVANIVGFLLWPLKQVLVWVARGFSNPHA